MLSSDRPKYGKILAVCEEEPTPQSLTMGSMYNDKHINAYAEMFKHQSSFVTQNWKEFCCFFCCNDMFNVIEYGNYGNLTTFFVGFFDDFDYSLVGMVSNSFVLRTRYTG